MILFKPNPVSGVPIYLQLMEQIRHAVATGSLKPGDQLPGMRKLAEDLVINPNTVAKVYRELEHEGLVELRQGAGAFVASGSGQAEGERLRRALPVIKSALARLTTMGCSEEEIRRLVELELARLRHFFQEKGTP